MADLEPLRRRAEWSFVRFVRGVYSGQPFETWKPESPLRLSMGLTGTGAARPMLDHAAPLIAKGTWQFLARQGGFRKRDVVVKGRAKSGRLWDEPVWGAEPLRLTGATIAWLAEIHDDFARGDTPRGESIAFAGALAAGDRLALTAAMGQLRRSTSLEISPAATTLLARLPLFVLANPDRVGAPPELKLAEDQESIALQYLDDAIALAWVSEIRRLQVRTTVAEQAGSFKRLSGILRALFVAASAPSNDQVHLLSPVVLFYPMLWRDLGGVDGISAWIGRASEGLSTRAERENYEFNFGDLLHHGVALDDRAHHILQTPWPDRTESQKRLVAEHETRYREIRDEVRTLARRFRREFG